MKTGDFGVHDCVPPICGIRVVQDSYHASHLASIKDPLLKAHVSHAPSIDDLDWRVEMESMTRRIDEQNGCYIVIHVCQGDEV